MLDWVVCVQGLVSFLLPCFAVDHLYLYCDEYLSSEVETPLTEGEAPRPPFWFPGALLFLGLFGSVDL